MKQSSARAVEGEYLHEIGIHSDQSVSVQSIATILGVMRAETHLKFHPNGCGKVNYMEIEEPKNTKKVKRPIKSHTHFHSVKLKCIEATSTKRKQKVTQWKVANRVAARVRNIITVYLQSVLN